MAGIELARSNEVPAATPSAGARGKAAPADGAGSFGDVMASMDEAPGTVDASGAPDDSAGRSSKNKDKAPDAGAATDAGATPPAAVAQAAASAPAAVDPALLLAQSGYGMSPPSTPPLAPSRDMATTAGAATDTAIAGVTVDGVRVDPQAAPQAPGLPTAPLDRPAGSSPVTPGTAKDTGTVDSKAAGLGVALLGRKDGLKDPLRASTTTTAQDGTSAVPRPTSAGAIATAANAADAAATARTAAPAAEAAVAASAAALSAATEAPAPWRRIERAGESATGHPAGAGGVDNTALSASPLITAPDAAGASANGAGAGLTERMVEQVSWWLAHRTQGAELKLDMPGGAPVSVSVQVTGNEAHVAFRSDSPEARQWLGSALPQLKEMFGNEGLMLSGASVGSSGTGAEQEAARDAQRAARAGNGGGVGAGGSAGIDAPAAVAARPRSAVERALDLYV